MAFPTPLAAKMSGATNAQLAYWRRTGALPPEVESTRPPFLYSFRDLLAIRIIMRFRAGRSLKFAREAMTNLPLLDAAEHPANYELVKVGNDIRVEHADNAPAMFRSKIAAGKTLGTIDDVFAAFEAPGPKKVEPFLRPTQHLEVHPGKRGGWPTIVGTRVPYDAVAKLMGDDNIEADRVWHYYPGVTTEAALDALDFHESVADAARPAGLRKRRLE